MGTGFSGVVRIGGSGVGLGFFLFGLGGGEIAGFDGFLGFTLDGGFFFGFGGGTALFAGQFWFVWVIRGFGF